MRNIYIIRHGQTTSNAGGEACPNPEIPLTDLGREQAESVSQWLIEHILDIQSVGVSKYKRTHDTATPLLAKLNKTANEIDGLYEFNYLCFDNIKNLTATERRNLASEYWRGATPTYIDTLADGSHEEGVESFAHFTQRVDKVIAYFYTLSHGNHVVYTHGLWISMLLWRLLAMPIHNNTAMQQFRQFELSVRTKNTEIFQLQLHDNLLPAITKIRTLSNY